MKVLITSNFKKYYNTYIDFLDHYWIDYFDKYKIFFHLIPNSISNLKVILKTFDDTNLIILPGGNDIGGFGKLSKKRLRVECELIKIAIKKKIPVLGICRGMQVINYFFKGNIRKKKGHMNTKHKIYLKNNFFFKKDKMVVNSFHNYCIPEKNVSKKFSILAIDSNNNVEMFKHEKLNIFGIMWHPEREKNYKNLNNIIKRISLKKI